MYRLKAYGVKSTILFFGSARAKSREQYDDRFANLSEKVQTVWRGGGLRVRGPWVRKRGRMGTRRYEGRPVGGKGVSPKARSSTTTASLT